MFEVGLSNGINLGSLQQMYFKKWMVKRFLKNIYKNMLLWELKKANTIVIFNNIYNFN